MFFSFHLVENCLIIIRFILKRTIFCLGYQVLENKQEQKRLKLLKLPNVFLQINGYKPQPLDLNNIALNTKLEELVELLAENTHNVWAKERIKSGWTYGVCEVNCLSRNLLITKKSHL